MKNILSTSFVVACLFAVTACSKTEPPAAERASAHPSAPVKETTVSKPMAGAQPFKMEAPQLPSQKELEALMAEDIKKSAQAQEAASSANSGESSPEITGAEPSKAAVEPEKQAPPAVSSKK